MPWQHKISLAHTHVYMHTHTHTHWKSSVTSPAGKRGSTWKPQKTNTEGKKKAFLQVAQAPCCQPHASNVTQMTRQVDVSIAKHSHTTSYSLLVRPPFGEKNHCALISVHKWCRITQFKSVKKKLCLLEHIIVGCMKKPKRHNNFITPHHMDSKIKAHS